VSHETEPGERTTGLAAALPPAPTGWTRHITLADVEYRYTEGLAARAKVTVRPTEQGYRLESKQGCRLLAETTVDSPEAAGRAVREALSD
jgi:hypothetical protein